MKYYDCPHYDLVYQRDTCIQYDACKLIYDYAEKEYINCRRDKCPKLLYVNGKKENENQDL